ncbi:hypothetical protein R6Q59_010327 [Mikania micrantha]
MTSSFQSMTLYSRRYGEAEKYIFFLDTMSDRLRRYFDEVVFACMSENVIQLLLATP